jgi:hypothetical protein
VRMLPDRFQEAYQDVLVAGEASTSPHVNVVKVACDRVEHAQDTSALLRSELQSQLPGRGRELISQSMHVFKICMEAQSFQGSADGSRRRLFGELFSERLHDILWKVLMHGEQLVQPLREVIGAFCASHA